jgi:hypothetical protein
VHEKPRVVTRRQITDGVGEESTDPAMTVSREIEPGTVLEVRESSAGGVVK